MVQIIQLITPQQLLDTLNRKGQDSRVMKYNDFMTFLQIKPILLGWRSRFKVQMIQQMTLHHPQDTIRNNGQGSKVMWYNAFLTFLKLVCILQVKNSGFSVQQLSLTL